MSAPRRALPSGPSVEGAERSDRPRTSSRRQVPPIHVRGLRKRFGSVVAVDGLTFDVLPGRVTGFLGPNGAGKTTTLRMLVGLATPTAGTATFGDQAYAELDNPQRVVGCVLEPGFHPGRSGRNHLRVLATTASVDDARVDELLELVGLTDAARRPVGGYSLGMRQRLALAGALLGDPDYLILDEPANGLDPEGIRWLRAFLRGFAAGGRTVLVSSHLLGEVQASVDDVVVIGRGRLLRQAPMSELQVDGGATRVRVSDLVRARHALALLEVAVQTGEDAEGPFLRVATPQTGLVGRVLFDAGLPVHELARERRDLEAQFFAMVEGAT